MTIQEIKKEIGIKEGYEVATLMLTTQKDASGVETDWVSHWDNDHRVRVTMHNDVAIEAQKGSAKLALKRDVVEAHLDTTTQKNVEKYTRYIVITPKDVKFSF